MSSESDSKTATPGRHAPWHSLSVAESLRRAATRTSGLTAEEVATRRPGRNVITVRSPRSVMRMIGAQFVDPLVIVLLLAAALSAVATQELLQSAIILLLVVVNAALGASQEFRAARSLDALRQTSSPMTTVRRDSRDLRIPTPDLVVGDIVLLAAGDRVSADLRLIEAIGLQVDESSLTGESLALDKSADAIPASTYLADRSCQAFASTLVRRGRASGIVVSIGDDTEVGRIARYTSAAAHPPTPLQRQLARLGLVASVTVGLLAVGMVVIGLVQGRDLIDLLLLGVALAVSAIPEGLVAIAAIVLAGGVRRMADRGAIIRTLPTVETLGAVDVICVDKTGTLTENRMTVTDFWQLSGGSAPSQQLTAAAVSCNDAARSVSADPLETALLAWAGQLGGTAEERHGELAFDPERRLMTTAHRTDAGTLETFTKGGFEELLAICTSAPAAATSARAAHDSMTRRGLRVIAFARGEVAGDVGPAAWEQGLDLVGIVALEDPPRPGAAEAIARARAAGITVVMITGDHVATATSIADQIGLLWGRSAMMGSRVDALTDAELDMAIHEIGVFARVVPQTKMRIVQAYQRRGSIVAMTGDGVNDGPALSSADVGCAMGRSGTDVAREAADLVITDDHLDTILEAVAEGRRTHDNLRKVVEFLLTTNAGELLLIVGSLVAGIAAPLSPAHILVINLLTDGGPALALAADPPAVDLMRRPPRRHSLLTHATAARIGYQGILFAAAAMASFLIAGGTQNLEHARTAAFITLALSQVIHPFSVRTPNFAGSAAIPRNSALISVALATAVLTLGLPYIPLVNSALGLHPLGLSSLLCAATLAIAPFVVIETTKLAGRHIRLTGPRR